MAIDQDIRPIMTAKELLSLNITEIPMLVENLMQKTGLVGITGSSDVGKSTFLRQLAFSISSGQEDFLGFKLNTDTNKVIYISTEDMMTDLAYITRKQLGNPSEIDDCWDNLIFITDTEKIEQVLIDLMSQHSPDCVIIDAFTDIHKGDNNMSTSVRSTLNVFKEMAQKFHTLFVVLNHVGKRTENNRPSKHNSMGSQGFEAKMRMLAEIRLDKTDSNLRHLCIVKGNYLPAEDKEYSIVLEMDGETLTYRNTGQRIHFDDLISSNSSMRDEWLPKVCALKKEDPDRTIDDIYDKMKDDGFTGSRSTIGNYASECS